MTTTVAPRSSSAWNTPSSTRTSSGCRPMLGSSNTNTESVWMRPISLANFSRCASPPERLGVSSPSCCSTCSFWLTVFLSAQNGSAVLTSMSISSGRETDCPALFVSWIS